MKRMVFASSLLAVTLVSPLIGHAQSMDMKGMEMKGMKSDAKTQGQIHKGAGTVTNVDPAKGAVTIAHGPVQSLKWPSMTMSFGVKDKAMLEQVKPGAKVEFEFVQSGKDYLITKVK